MSKEIPMHKHMQHIVNAQVDINRAVWAANLTNTVEHSSCNTEADRNKYVIECLKSALKSITEVLEKSKK